MAASLYLSILLQVVEGLQTIARDAVVHFDLKCSNVLIEPLPGVKDSELWNPLGAKTAPSAGAVPEQQQQQQYVKTGGSSSSSNELVVPFQAALADFGEARSYRNADAAFTVRRAS